jgi:hypothetical protein
VAAIAVGNILAAVGFGIFGLRLDYLLRLVVHSGGELLAVQALAILLLEGDGSVEWLMFYREDGTASFVGMQHVVGRIGSRSGSFVLETSGSYDGKTARASWSIVPGSGTNGLSGLHGSETYVAGHGSTAEITLEYELA